AARNQRAQGVKDAAVRVADDVAGDNRVLGVLEDTLQRAVGRFLEDLVDLRRRYLLPQFGGQVGDAAVGDRHAQGEAVELALQVGQHLADRLGRAGRRRDDVLRR